MSDLNQPDIFDELKDDATGWVKARIDLLRLELTERFATVVASLVSGGFVLVLVFFLLLFLMLALGFWLGDLWHSIPLGMLAVAGIVFIKILLFLALRKPLLEHPLIDAIIRKSFEHESSEKS
jgi:uncharacterized membrane protein YqjE